MRRITYLIASSVWLLATSPMAQPLSPHEKVSEIYSIMNLCPALKVDRQALDRFAMLNGIDLTPGSLAEKWFLKRAAYEQRKLGRRNVGYFCRQGLIKYGPEGGVTKGLMLMN